MFSYNTFGEYNYYSYTKIDTYSNNDDFLITATAVHEFVHSILIKTTSYGSYVTLLFHGNKNNKRFLQYVEKNVEKQQIKNNRNDKILNSLVDNMIQLQEATATLVELIYVMARLGLEEMNKYFFRLGESYKKYIRAYEHILQESYISDYERVYMNWLKNENISYYNELNNADSQYRKFNIVINIVIKLAIIALNIDRIDADNKKWQYPNAMINTILVDKKNHPSKRFDDLMKSVFKPIEALDKNNPFIGVNLEWFISTHYEIKDELLDKVYNKFESEYLEARNSNLLSEVRYVQGIDWNSIEALERNAVLTGIPSILSKSSSEKIFRGYLSPFKNTNLKNVHINKTSISDFDSELYKVFIQSKTVFLSIVPSGSYDVKYEYEFHVEQDIIENELLNINHIRLIVLGRDNALSVLKEVDATKLVLLGVDRDPDIIDESIIEKFERTFIYPANNVLSFIDIINDRFSGSTIHITKDEYFHMMYIRNNKKILFQPVITMIDSYIKQTSSIKDRTIKVNGDLPFRKSDKKLIDRILYKLLLEEAIHYRTLKEDLY